MISELIDRTGRIVRQLKSFARQEAATPQPVSVASAIDHARMMLEPRRRELQAMFHVEPCGDLQLLAEAGRLEQVLVNLLRNGLDAMHGQGTYEALTDKSKRTVHLDKEYLKFIIDTYQQRVDRLLKEKGL